MPACSLCSGPLCCYSLSHDVARCTRVRRTLGEPLLALRTLTRALHAPSPGCGEHQSNLEHWSQTGRGSSLTARDEGDKPNILWCHLFKSFDVMSSTISMTADWCHFRHFKQLWKAYGTTQYSTVRLLYSTPSRVTSTVYITLAWKA